MIERHRGGTQASRGHAGREASAPKASVDELAVLGGAPLFNEALHVGRPNLGDRALLLELIGDVLDRNWLTNDGPLVREFERKICELTSVRHCVAMCNGTVALEIASRALGMAGEVIVPSFTFVATAHCLQWQGITPVFSDVDAASHHLDPFQVERMITPRTTGILAVHTWGEPCDVDALAAISARRGLRLLFDAAHAFGASDGDTAIGNFGDAEVFSFHATKFLNTFEGGAVVTNNDDLARRMRLMRNFGFTGLDAVAYIGTNGKMSEIAAAMGIVNLGSMSSFIAINRDNFEWYERGLHGIPGVRLYPHGAAGATNYQYVVVEIDDAVAGLTRDQIVHLLVAENVLARRYFHPGCHRMEPYRSYFPNAGLMLPVTEKLTDRVMVLPTGTAVGAPQIADICALVGFAVEHASTLRARIPGAGRAL